MSGHMDPRTLQPDAARHHGGWSDPRWRGPRRRRVGGRIEPDPVPSAATRTGNARLLKDIRGSGARVAAGGHHVASSATDRWHVRRRSLPGPRSRRRARCAFRQCTRWRNTGTDDTGIPVDAWTPAVRSGEDLSPRLDHCAMVGQRYGGTGPRDVAGRNPGGLSRASRPGMPWPSKAANGGRPGPRTNHRPCERGRGRPE
jgi:hypothetical protein